MKKQMVIGVLGGMGTYATVHFFKQYADVFEADKEWERPRILIDNRCTMPSRVRAFLFHEEEEKLVKEMTESINGLIGLGANRIVLACNTSHLFLPRIYDNLPDAKELVIDIIDVCSEKITSDKLSEVYLLASEGTIESNIYQTVLEKYDIQCHVPKKEEYDLLRKCIEAVKKNIYTEEVEEIFVSLVNRNNYCILGCTELPILFEKYSHRIRCKRIYDPLGLVLRKLKEEFINE